MIIQPRIFLWPLAVILVLSSLGVAHAHEARPLFVEVKERAPNAFLASWKIPPTVKRGNAPRIELPASCRAGRNSNPRARSSRCCSAASKIWAAAN